MGEKYVLYGPSVLGLFGESSRHLDEELFPTFTKCEALISGLSTGTGTTEWVTVDCILRQNRFNAAIFTSVWVWVAGLPLAFAALFVTDMAVFCRDLKSIERGVRRFESFDDAERAVLVKAEEEQGRRKAHAVYKVTFPSQ